MNSPGIAAFLAKENFITENELSEHTLKARESDMPIISYLASKKLINSNDFAILASERFGLPYFNLSVLITDTIPKKIISEELVRKHRALPIFKRNNILFLAVSDPTNFAAISDIKFQSRLKCETVVVDEVELLKLIDSTYETTSSLMSGSDEDYASLTFDDDTKDSDAKDDSDIDEAPIVKFVNKILLDSIRKGASDIHLEVFEKTFRIRFRIDGVLQEIASPPSNLANRLISRIKVMSKMDIAERRVPQDGRIKIALSPTSAIDFRVNTCPTLFGEKVVMRILDPTSAKMGIEKLGFEPDQQKYFLEAIHKPYGLVLVTGPTGSGKTVSLYTGLNILNSVERNISTAEDPVEITVTGINQVNMNAKAGLTFETALKAFLRQDPDIIMVGEIRDKETADIAIKAAQTGHLVLSTLHTNDAPQTLNRLSQMGVAGFNIAASVNLIMAQRLARRLCEACKKPYRPPIETLLDFGFKKDDLPGLKIFEANTDENNTCQACNRGYKGRVGIYQVLPITEAMRNIIIRGGDVIEVENQAEKEGINDLRRSGILKVKQGITTIVEIDRVITGH